MQNKTKQIFHRGLSFLLAALMFIGTLGIQSIPVLAADGTLDFQVGKQIAYGSYFTTEMFVDGSNTAYCVQPLKKTPLAGTYSYDLLGQDSALRKALYYLPGGYGYEKHIKEQYLSGWSDDNQYVIGHLVSAYVYAGYDAESGAFYGAPEDFISKAVEIANAIKGLPNPPESFRAFIIPSSTNQTVAGSWYQVPYGSIELYKSSGNASVSDGNLNYSLAGAQYGIFHGESQVATLTTNEQGYAKADNLEVLDDGDFYTIRELSASPGFAIDVESHNVSVTPEGTATVKVKEIPQNQPLDLLLQKLDADLGASKPQGSGSLSGAEFTVKFYTEQMDTDPAQSGKKPERTWIFKTDASGVIRFSKDFFVSGDDFYYASDGKTICLPLGTVTIQETKAPEGYQLNSAVFVQKITGDGNEETISIYHAPNVEDEVFRGGVKIQKRDSETNGTNPQGGASLANAVFTITTLNEQPVVVNGKTYEKGQAVLTLSTNEAGLASTVNNVLPIGHYRIDETTPPSGYLGEGTISREFDITKNGEIVDLTGENSSISNQIIRGGVKVQKRDSETGGTTAQGSASLENAVFTITTLNENPVFVNDKSYKNGEVVLTLKTNKSGVASTAKDVLPYGRYRIDEITPPSGYLGEGTISREFSITENEKIVDLTAKDTSILNKVIRGGVKIQKRDLETGSTTPQGGAELSGAEFTITSLNTQPVVVNGKTYEKDQVVLTLKTDEKGLAATASDALPFGRYRVDEVTPPTGYLGEGTLSREFSITENGKIVELTDENTSIFNQVIRGGIKIQKRDAETGEAAAQGGASLKDAVFTITTLNEHPVYINGKSYEKDQVVLTLKTDENGIASTEANTLPYGHYRIEETTPPSGYLGEGVIFREFDIRENGKILDMTEKEDSILNLPIRGDLEFIKVSDGDLSRLANVPFTITSKTTGESHTIVTDQNGYASTSAEWNPHTQNTNAGKTAQDGIWFGTSEPDDEKGALLYDTYILEEQRCESNEGMNLLKIEVEVYRNKVTVDLGTLTDDRITIGTTALEQESNSHFARPEKELTLIDTVEYEGLQKGTEYKITGTLMDAETGKEILIQDKPVTAETTFKAKKSSGSVKVKFTFDATALAGKTIVVFESLYQDDLKLAVHADLEDQDQTIYFPEIGTQAKDSDTGTQHSCADEEVTLIDTVSYSNLLAGEKYTLTGTLMDAETGKEIEIDGKPVTAASDFTPKESSGTTEVKFTFDASSLSGKTVVIFESLSYDGSEICSHKDLSDEGQTIFFPSLKTQAQNEQTGNQLSAPSEKVTIKDTVSYTNLIPGKEYTISGVLMDQETEKELLVNDKPVTAQETFTPETSDGSIALSFTLDASALAGKTTVAFETLKQEDKTVGVHADIKDEQQSVYFPKISTTAKDASDGDQTALIGTEVSIIDTVTYSNLVPGLTYKLTGTLMEQETGKAIEQDGTPVTAEVSFTPEKTSGTVDVTFTWNTSEFTGKSVVVFEKLFLVTGETEVLIASHEDLDDEGQTISLTNAPEETPPETPEESPKTSEPVKTGDTTNIGLYIAIAAVSLLVLISLGGYFFYRHRNRKE